MLSKESRRILRPGVGNILRAALDIQAELYYIQEQLQCDDVERDTLAAVLIDYAETVKCYGPAQIQEAIDKVEQLHSQWTIQRLVVEALERNEVTTSSLNFYTPEEWQRRGEDVGDDADYSLTYEGPVEALIDDVQFGKDIQELGYWFDQGYDWSTHFYKEIDHAG